MEGGVARGNSVLCKVVLQKSWNTIKVAITDVGLVSDQQGCQTAHCKRNSQPLMYMYMYKCGLTKATHVWYCVFEQKLQIPINSCLMDVTFST